VLVAAALVPPTALLVPGASGATPVLGTERAAAVAAVTALRGARPDVVVVVAPCRDAPSHRTGRLRPTLAAAGIEDARLGWPPRPSYGRGPAVPVEDVAAAVGLLLLDRAGWTGPVEVAGVGAAPAPELHRTGADLVADRAAALLLVGGLSARRGPDGPLAPDERAAVADDAAIADLTDLGPAARRRLAEVPAQLADELATSAWAPWQVLLGALPDDAAAPARTTRHHVGAPFGATYASLSWRWA
jgi:hypothetical protein